MHTYPKEIDMTTKEKLRKIKEELEKILKQIDQLLKGA